MDCTHDDVIKWHYFLFLLDLCVGNSPVTGEFPAQRPVTRSFDAFLIFAWINDWVNKRKTGQLSRYRAHHDVSRNLNTNILAYMLQ